MHVMTDRNSIEAGVQTVCRITAIQAFNKGPVTEPSYARWGSFTGGELKAQAAKRFLEQ